MDVMGSVLLCVLVWCGCVDGSNNHGMVGDLELLRDVYAERGQRRLDRLSIVVSVVGIAGICNDAFANSFGEFMEDEGYWTTLVWVPAGMTILFAILGLLLAYWLKFRM